MITEEMLTAAALELSDTMNKYMPSPEDCVHTFSLRFHRKMRKVIRKAEHPVLYQFARKAAAIVLIIFLGFMTLIAVSPSVRADVVGWIKEKYRSFITYYFVEHNSVEYYKSKYEVSPIPEGYSITYSDHNTGYGRITYQNNNKMVRISYITDPTKTQIYLDTENINLSETNYNGVTLDIYTDQNKSGNSTIIAYFENNQVLCFLAGNVSENELIDFLENFKKII